MTQAPHRAPLALAIACALAGPLYAAEGAAENPDAHALPELTVRQARPAVLADNPSPGAQVTAEQIRDINVVNSEDVLRYAPSLNIRTRYIGDRNSVISARTAVGTTPSASALVYADGLLLANLLGNSYSFPPRWNLVGAEEIESVDVLYGPFSALLPGNSIGSTVLITTRRPETTEVHARLQTYQEHFALYGTDQNFGGQQAQASAGFRLGALRVSLLGNHLDAHGQPMSFATKAASTTSAGANVPVVGGVREDTDSTGARRLIFGGYSIDHTVQDTGKIRLDYEFSPDTRAAFTWAEFRNDSFTRSESYVRDAAGNPLWSGNVNVGGQQYTLAAGDLPLSDRNELNRLLGLTINSRVNAQWRLEATASRYSTPTDITRAPTGTLPAAQSGGAGNLTLADGTGWQNLDLKAIWQAQPSHTATFGYHADQYRIASRQYSAGNWLDDGSLGKQTAGFHGQTETAAWFAQEVWKLDPRWTATFGLRHEHWQAGGGERQSTQNGRLLTSSYAKRDERFSSPKLSLAWLASADWLLRASLARAYRMPTVSELFQTETRNGTSTISDPSLRPERVLAKDLTAETGLAGGSLRLSLFEELKDDALFAQTTSVGPIVSSTQNIGRTRVRGAEAAFQGYNVGLPRLDLAASLTYAAAKVLANPGRPETVGMPLAIPTWRATLFASYRFNDAWSASAGLRHGSERPSLNSADRTQNVYGGTSGYTVLDARLNYRFNQSVGAALGIDNLTDNKYFAYHPMPQRTVHAELRFDY